MEGQWKITKEHHLGKQKMYGNSKGRTLKFWDKNERVENRKVDSNRAVLKMH